MTSCAEPRFGGYPWDMNASRALDERLAEIVARRGIVPATDEQMQAADERAQREWFEAKAQVLISRLPEVYRSAEPHHSMTEAWIRDYRNGARRNLVIVGANRVGKTWEANAVARILLTEDRLPVTVVEAPTMIEALRPNRDGASDMGQFQLAPVLVVDDLGAEKITQWSGEQVYQLVNYRSVHRLPTIYTTNLSSAEITLRYGDRISWRIAEDADVLAIHQMPAGVRARTSW